MPTYIRPARVTISEDGGSPLAAVVVLVGLAVVVSSAAAIITDVLTAILIVLGVVAVAGVGVLVILLRRSRPPACSPPAPARAPVPGQVAGPVRVISAPPRLAIEAPRTADQATAWTAATSPAVHSGPVGGTPRE